MGRDTRSVIIETLNLYDQNDAITIPGVSWEGDWIFRRERLLLLDQTLRSVKPDVMLMQQMLTRGGSPVDSDDAILSYGALSGYEFEKRPISKLDIEAEVEYLAAAVSPPAKLVTSRFFPEGRIWHLENGTSMMLSLVEVEGLVISIFNIDTKKIPTNYVSFYQEISNIVETFLAENQYCKNRLVVAGLLPGETQDPSLQNFLEELDLDDVSAEKCADAGSCVTASDDNVLFSILKKKPDERFLDRILVSKDSEIVAVNLTFDNKAPASEYSERYKLKKINIAPRYGWSAEVRFGRCSFEKD